MRSFSSSAFALVAGALLASATPAAAQEAAVAEEAPAGLDLATPSPVNPALVTGELDNGLRYVIQQHGNPEDHVNVWLHVHSGSLNETDPQRGIAHYLEHMAFNGSENFPPGTVVKFFESLGLSFGRDQNAFTSFDQTTYQLDLPETTDEMLERGMLFMSDVAFRLLLREEEIESERGIIVEEKRARSGAGQRVQFALLKELAPESTFGERLPIGTDETLQSVMKPDFVAYYSKWYVPSNMTVIVVGDIAPERVVPAIEKHFGEAPKADRPEPLPVGVKDASESRAVIVTDADLQTATVTIVKVGPARPASLTIGDYRRDLIEYMSSWIINRRLSTLIAEGKAPFLSASAGAGQSANVLRTSQARATGKPEAWKDMLEALAVEVQRARLHGFTEQELADARSAIDALLDQAVETESTRPARAVLNGINRAVTSGEPMMSAAQEKEIATELMQGITVDEVGAAFAASFDIPHPLFQLTMPEGDGVPSREDLLKAGTAAMDVKPEAAEQAERASALMETIPAPGAIAEQTRHESSGVTSIWFENGVRMHHRFMDKRKESASIAITLPGGEIQETAENRGITAVATLAFNRAATSNLSSTQIRDLMTGKTVGVGGGAGPDSLSLSCGGNPDDLETGMQLVHLLLTDPVIEEAAFDQWKQAQLQGIAGRKVNPGGVMAEAFMDAMYPEGEMRTRPLEAAHVKALDRDAAQAWLKGIIATAPIEVSVVGDISLEQATQLVGTYLASLPKRERIHTNLFADLRKIERPTGPIRVSRTVETTTPQAMVIGGFYGVDRTNIKDLRPMFMASRILSTRMIDTIREEKRLVYSIGASSGPAVTYPGFGFFAAQAPTDPAKAEELVAALDETWDEFAKGGPTEEEMEKARAQMDNMLSTSFDQPNFWIGRLASHDYRGNDLDTVMEMEEAYQAITAQEVQETFARYAVPENRFSVVVTPAGAEESGSDDAE
jgi:zinc protease